MAQQKKEKTFLCSLCGLPTEGMGNNPEPILPYDKRCCGDCNMNFVIPARLGHTVYVPHLASLADQEKIKVKKEKPSVLSDDPYYNLLGALHDLENGINDAVVHETIRRVMSQIKGPRQPK